MSSLLFGLPHELLKLVLHIVLLLSRPLWCRGRPRLYLSCSILFHLRLTDDVVEVRGILTKTRKFSSHPVLHSSAKARVVTDDLLEDTSPARLCVRPVARKIRSPVRATGATVRVAVHLEHTLGDLHTSDCISSTFRKGIISFVTLYLWCGGPGHSNWNPKSWAARVWLLGRPLHVQDRLLVPPPPFRPPGFPMRTSFALLACPKYIPSWSSMSSLFFLALPSRISL